MILHPAFTDNCRDPFFSFNFEFLEHISLTRYRFNKEQCVKNLFFNLKLNVKNGFLQSSIRGRGISYGVELKTYKMNNKYVF